MTKEVIINFARPGKGIMRYIEGLVDENAIRIETLNQVPPDSSLQWCEEVWWPNGLIPHGTLIGSVRKYLFKKEWFSIMELLDTSGDHLGFYVDIDTPLRKSGAELYLTDLFLDLWIRPDGTFVELDRDEFEKAYQVGLLTTHDYKKAQQVLNQFVDMIVNGDYLRLMDKA